MVNKNGTIGAYIFKNINLLEEALTHPSLANSKHYQRLEFLGDRVLGLIIAERLLKQFPTESEGKLNNRFVSLVRKETLAVVAEQAGLVPLIEMSHGAEAEGTRGKEAIQADVCEAVIGALYLDGGMAAASEFIDLYFSDRMTIGVGAKKDHKTRLQEWTQARALSLPVYTEVNRSGPDHSPTFEIEVSIEGHGSARANGKNKRDAQQDAAKILYKKLETSP